MQRANKTKSKRFLLVQAFWDEAQPQSLEDLNVVFRKTNMLQHITKIFHTPSSRWLQTILLAQYPMLKEWVSNNNNTSSTDYVVQTAVTRRKSEDALYVGLHECIQNDSKTLHRQIAALQEAIAYAEMRKAHPNENVLARYCAQPRLLCQ